MLMPLGMTIMTRAAGPHRMGRLMAILGVPMLLGPILGPILGGWLIEQRQLALDLPHQRPDRRRRTGLRVRSFCRADAPEPSESFDFVGMALHVARPRAVPLRRLVDACRRGRRLQLRHGCGSRCSSGVLLMLDLRLARVPARAPAARPAAVQEPQPHGRDHHDVHVRGGVLRRAAAGADLLPAGPRRVDPRRRPAGRAAGHRRDADDADRRRRWSTRCRSAASCPFGLVLIIDRLVRADPDRGGHAVHAADRGAVRAWASAWAAR